ncbi:MAG TPA: non-ribosomal peptide synthetase, partial [Caldithrix abyssi]|nr:non-ribosomal peptide synthetase [Caldithrix abyssi]
DISALKANLKQKLPEYMVPAVFMELEAMPMLPSGKIDRRALESHEVAETSGKSEYVAPGSEKEKILAEIWQQVLGLEKIGVNDNFFELGGDSILSIQVISRARQQGLNISPMQMFQYQTISQLAAVVTDAPIIEAEQGLVTGSAPLTPIQHWFFDQPLEHRHHWNQSLLLEVNENLDPEHLNKVARALLEHHDVLRLQFTSKDGRWQQTFGDVPEEAPFHFIDLSQMNPDEQKQKIEQECARFQASFDLQSGPLIRVVYFDTGALPHRLLLVIHHLAVDGVSWRILLEDIQVAYQQSAAGREIQLPPKSTSYKQWAQKLQEYANSEKMNTEIAYWSDIADKELPIITPDFPDGKNPEKLAQGIAHSLNEQETEALLKDVPTVYKTEINDILLTALTRAFARWNGRRSLLIKMEGHGREDIFENVDISRTMGWFTSLYPVYLNLEGVYAEGDSIKTVKEQLRGIPNNGIGYGILRYLSTDESVRQKLTGLDQAAITFNYLGQFDQVLPEGSVFKPAKENKGPERNPDDRRVNVISFTCAVTGNKLNVSVSYSSDLFKAETISRLSDAFMEELRALIDHCKSPQAGGFTASDFKLANLDNKKLDNVLNQLKKNKRKK